MLYPNYKYLLFMILTKDLPNYYMFFLVRSLEKYDGKTYSFYNWYSITL